MKIYSYSKCIVFALTLLLLSITMPSFAVNNNNALSEKLDTVATAFQKNRHFMGTVLVAQNNRILLEKAYGMADLEWNTPNTIDAKFRLGSITKQFTATAILQLAEQHKLSLTDPACKYFDVCPKIWQKITIRQLLNHTSGIPSYTDDKKFLQPTGKRIPKTPAETLLLSKNKPLNFKPGTQWKYSNSGYIFLGLIIEKVSGEKYADYIKQHIFEPLSMSNSGYDRTEEVLYHRASGYRRCAVQFCNADYIDMSIPFSAGALYSTVEDLYKWDRSLYTDKVLSLASRQQMFTPVMNNYGYGVDLTPMANHTQIGHGGSIEGFNTYIARFPKDDTVVIVLSNVEIDSRSIAISLADTVFGEQAYIPTAMKTISIDPVLYKRYVGTYKVKDFLINVANQNGRLMIGPQDQPKLEALPISSTEFYTEQLDATFTFIPEKKGKTMKIKVQQGANPIMEGTRIPE